MHGPHRLSPRTRVRLYPISFSQFLLFCANSSAPLIFLIYSLCSISQSLSGNANKSSLAICIGDSSTYFLVEIFLQWLSPLQEQLAPTE
ncbi:hypothetical protein V1512DRAFT_256857 [Lipomyces arxii]|uniref:uncharacterized protein n=1 Tax=Lipomyces arxii TaxID=56418 RepID=UPI0034CD767F